MVKFDPEKQHRHSIRLKNYDYSSNGAYFVTICTKGLECLFGDIVSSTMILNDAGKMVKTIWEELPDYYSGLELDTFCLMPNHIHGIILLVGVTPRGYPENEKGLFKSGQPQRAAPTLSLPDAVHRFKTLTTKRYIDGVRNNNWLAFNGKLWQRNYFDRIIRNEKELLKIRNYIYFNPVNWDQDEENPLNDVGARHAVPLYAHKDK